MAIEVDGFRALRPGEVDAIRAAAARYGTFADLPIELVGVPA